jgi:hypothetical protein
MAWFKSQIPTNPLDPLHDDFRYQYGRWFRDNDYPSDGVIYVDAYRDLEAETFNIYFPPESVDRLHGFIRRYQAGPCNTPDMAALSAYIKN